MGRRPGIWKVVVLILAMQLAPHINLVYCGTNPGSSQSPTVLSETATALDMSRNRGDLLLGLENPATCYLSFAFMQRERIYCSCNMLKRAVFPLTYIHSDIRMALWASPAGNNSNLCRYRYCMSFRRCRNIRRRRSGRGVVIRSSSSSCGSWLTL